MGLWDRMRQGLGELVEDLSIGDQVRSRLERARVALKDGRLDQATTLLEEATRLDPDYFRSWYLLGVTLFRQGTLDRSVAALERAAAAKPEDIETLLALAQAHRARGELTPALARAKQALSGRGNGELLDQVYGLLGELHLERGDVDRAVRELRKAVAASRGEDPELLALLGRAHHRAGTLPLARQALGRAATARPPDPGVLALLAEVLLELGVVSEARLAALRLVEDHDGARARCLLARCLLHEGQPEQAREQLLRALPATGANDDAGDLRVAVVEVHRLLAEVHLAVDDPREALRQLRIARQIVDRADPALLSMIAELALETDEPAETLAAEAEALLALRADDAVGLAVSGAARAAADDPNADHALALVARSLAADETHAGRLALGLVHLAGGRFREAQVALRAALRLRPTGRRAHALLVEAYRRGAADGPDRASAGAAVYPTLGRLRRLLAQRAGFDELQLQVGAIERDFDRPLLVAVMGEFNSGKSTFVNALIGEEIAPMGVTPTTATINLLKYGEQRAARVVWSDDREETLAWQQVGAFLRGLDNQRAQRVRVVELLYPAEELLRVNVVDTPGLNSMIAEHEATAREYLQQADAVVWLFCADQAGKQTEQQALDMIRRQRLKTVGVINKIDRLQPGQLEEVRAHLTEGFSDLVEAIVPVSAREALQALVSNDDQGLARSRFSELRTLLEQRIFSRSRRIKRQVCEARLRTVLEQARQQVARQLEPLSAALERLVDLGDRFQAEQAVDPRDAERTTLRRDFERVYRQAAEEVLDFVRPGRSALFGQHRATRADRDFLVELLGDGLAAVAGASHQRVARGLGQRTARLSDELGQTPPLQRHVSELGRVVDQQLQLLRQQVYTRFDAFVHGFLAGGWVDHFFEHQLPELVLEPEPVFRVLTERSLAVDSELLDPLGEWHAQTGAALAGCLAGWRHELSMSAMELDAGLLAPLGELLVSVDANDQPAGSGQNCYSR